MELQATLHDCQNAKCTQLLRGVPLCNPVNHNYQTSIFQLPNAYDRNRL